MSGYTHVVHEFEPVFDERSRVLILGSLPSVKSRETGFYYGHPRNRFWAVTAALTGRPLPQTVSEKKALLLDSQIAVWDVIAECDIIGSGDASIKNAVPADLARIFEVCPDVRVFTNGSTAGRYYNKYQFAKTGRAAVILPSTSPANAAWGLERLTEEWRRQIFSGAD